MVLENFNETQEIRTFLPKDQVRLDEPLSNHTTFRLGGPADVFWESRDIEEIRRVLSLCQEKQIPYFFIGTGANLLVGDRGVRGLVIRVSDNEIRLLKSQKSSVNAKPSTDHYQPFETGKYLKFDDLDLVEPPPDTLVRVGAGVSLPVLISWTLDQGLTGLQNFAGIPASLGGSIYNNIHGGTKLFDQFVENVTVLARDGQVKAINHSDLDFHYDHSRLQSSGEIILEAVLRLSHGEIEKARWVREEWLKRKLKIQPQVNCPGCIFRNLSTEDAQRIGSPTVGVGWVLDIGLNLKGTRIGGITVSEQHANFFVNNGYGKAIEVVELIDLCKKRAKEKFGLELLEEIQRVGEF